MNTAKFLNDFAKQFSESLPPPLKELKSEFEKQFNQGLTLALSKMSLVTQEEFEVQTSVLARTRDKVEQLERRLIALEAKIHESI